MGYAWLATAVEWLDMLADMSESVWRQQGRAAGWVWRRGGCRTLGTTSEGATSSAALGPGGCLGDDGTLSEGSNVMASQARGLEPRVRHCVNPSGGSLCCVADAACPVCAEPGWRSSRA